MLLPNLRWPLARNEIRKNQLANTFGMVRDGGKRPHQGWDLSAFPGNQCYAIADGIVKWCKPFGDYGNLAIVEFEYRGRTLYAAYGHLSMFTAIKDNDEVSAGDLIGLTGNTGNARTMHGADQHLHFEIRTTLMTGKGLGGHIDPRNLYGVVPLSYTVFDSRNGGPLSGNFGVNGLKIAGVNAK